MTRRELFIVILVIIGAVLAGAGVASISHIPLVW